MRLTYYISDAARERIHAETGHDPRIMQHLDVTSLSDVDRATLDAIPHTSDRVLLLLPGTHAVLTLDARVPDAAAAFVAYRAAVQKLNS